MKIRVIINDHIAYEEPVTSVSVDFIVDLAVARYNIALLNSCGVNAYVIIEVASKMNSPLFQAASEAYDELYFKDIMM